MPKTANGKLSTDIELRDSEGRPVLIIRKQQLSELEYYALVNMGETLHVTVAVAGRDTPEAYAQ